MAGKVIYLQGSRHPGTPRAFGGVSDGKANLSETHSRRVMKMRLIPPVAAQGAWLIAGRSAAGAFLLAAGVSACSGGGGSSVPSFSQPPPPTHGQSSGHPGTRTPSPTGQASRSLSSSPGATSTNRGGASAPSSPHASGPSSSHASAPSSSHASAPSSS